VSYIIVYGQKDLEKALENKIKKITLCAGEYEIPKAENICFNHLGPVKVAVLCSKREADEAGMIFDGIYPTYISEYAVSERAARDVVAVGSGSYGSGGSYVTSGGSYFGSGSGVHFYEYEFEYRGSMRGSGGSYHGSYGIISVDKSLGEDKTIRVYGYGIDLI
jgi:hypothetical protein